MKLKEYEMLKSKGKGGKEKKKKEIKLKNNTNKKSENGTKKTNIENNGKESEENRTNIQITDKELECDDSEFYPAEMVYWRSMEQYYLKANFICVVAYEHKSHRMYKKRDRIYLETKCKVIRPDFITNLNQQRIDFGNCLIGSITPKIVTIQNISYQNIRPEVSLLNPLGCFSVHYAPQDIILPPEQTMKLHIEFRPKDSNEATEYFEIKSNATIIQLILCGKGSQSVIHVTPEYEVYRMETYMSKLAELQLKIQNLSECEATIHFTKLFEIEAYLNDIDQNKEEKPMNITDNKNGNNEKKIKSNKDTKPKQKSVKETKAKVAKYSNNLTEKEIDDIEKCFNKIKASGSHFELKSPGNYIKIQPNATTNVSILCGEPEVIYSKINGDPKKSKKDKNEKHKETTSEKQASIKDNKKTIEDKQYISQYNIQMGEIHIKSVVIICTIKCSI